MAIKTNKQSYTKLHNLMKKYIKGMVASLQTCTMPLLDDIVWESGMVVLEWLTLRIKVGGRTEPKLSPLP